MDDSSKVLNLELRVSGLEAELALERSMRKAVEEVARQLYENSEKMAENVRKMAENVREMETAAKTSSLEYSHELLEQLLAEKSKPPRGTHL